MILMESNKPATAVAAKVVKDERGGAEGPAEAAVDAAVAALAVVVKVLDGGHVAQRPVAANRRAHAAVAVVVVDGDGRGDGHGTQGTRAAPDSAEEWDMIFSKKV